MPIQDWGWSGSTTTTPSSSLGVCSAPTTTPNFSLPPSSKDDGPKHRPAVAVHNKDDGPKKPKFIWVDVAVYEDRSRTQFERFVDIAISRPKFIKVQVDNLRPNTRHFVFYDGVNVTRFFKKDNTADFFNLTRSNEYRNPGDKYISENQFPAGLGGPTSQIFSEDDGTLTGWFYLQRGQAGTDAAGVQFSTGTKLLQFIDINKLAPNEALSYAEGNFVTDGGVEEYTKEWYKFKTGTTKVKVPNPN